MQSAIGYAKFYSRSHDAVIRVYDAAGSVIETHEHARRVQRGIVAAASTNALNFSGFFMLDRSVALRLKTQTVGCLG
ncbi:MAG: hypothetical protein DME88_12530 [Verrucomicrobia bacterium]|nr:MAG: hypothetical protein DME88_12530 [Verrucomicrobiota bacterium]